MTQVDLKSCEATDKQKLKAAVYSVEDVCAILKISVPHFYTLKNAGVFRPIKLGRRTLIPIAQVDDILVGEYAAI